MITVCVSNLHRFVFGGLAAVLAITIAMVPVHVGAENVPNPPDPSASQSADDAPAGVQVQSPASTKANFTAHIPVPDVNCLLTESSWLGCYEGLGVRTGWYQPRVDFRSAPKFWEFRTLASPNTIYALQH